MRYILLIFAATAALTQDSQVSAQSPAPTAVASDQATTPGYVAHRVYDSKRKRIIDFEAMAAALAKADIVFLGEQHDDPRTHQLEAAVLEGIARRRPEPGVLALEMFERDVQQPVDAYLARNIPEAEFLSGSRPWPNYRTDYRPLVEFARAHGWPVIAGNVPRRYASMVARGGLAALDTLPERARALIATDIACPRDDYWKRFRETMGDMSGHGMQLSPEQLEATVWRTYEAQCIKDETMAESVVAAFKAHGAPVVHANGAFHSDYGLGTAARVKRRLPAAKVVVVSFVPVADLDTIDGKAMRKLGDYVVFTLETPKSDVPVRP
jgi:uncharacterized iron-regulated protein